MCVCVYMSTRRCSVLYVVPYIHSDDSWRRHSRGRPAASLYEEQHPGHAHFLHTQDAGVHTQRGARVTTQLTSCWPLCGGFNSSVTGCCSSGAGTLEATTTAATPTSTRTPSRASTPVWPTSRPSAHPSTTPPTTGRLHRSVPLAQQHTDRFTSKSTLAVASRINK